MNDWVRLGFVVALITALLVVWLMFEAQGIL